MVSVAIAQFAPTSHKAWNLGKIEELADQAATGGARIIVFPEYSSWFSDKLDAEFFDHAEELDGPFVNRLKDVAAQKKLVIVAGMLERLAGSDQSRVSNTVVAVGVDGTVLARYRKVHLYDAFGSCESDWIRPGNIHYALPFSDQQRRNAVDHYQVRQYTGWYRPTTLSVLAHAFLTVTRSKNGAFIQATATSLP